MINFETEIQMKMRMKWVDLPEDFGRLDVKLRQELILWWREENRIFYPELSTFAALGDWRIAGIWSHFKADRSCRRCGRPSRRRCPHPYDLIHKN